MNKEKKERKKFPEVHKQAIEKKENVSCVHLFFCPAPTHPPISKGNQGGRQVGTAKDA